MKIGVDLGGTKIEAVLLDEQGAVDMRIRVETPADYEDLLKACAELVGRLKQRAPDATVGIGTPGAISLRTGRMKNCNNTCLNGRALKDDLATSLGSDLRIANDADCFTLSESVDGAGAGARTVFGVILGTGVGGGLFVNGTLVSGPNGIAGEWGHTRLSVPAYRAFVGQTISNPDSASRSCYCGLKDCVETWLSGPALERTFGEESGEALSAKDIIRRFRSGDILAAEVFHQYCQMLAIGLSSVINIIDPEVIVLGGGLSNIDEIYDGVQKHLPDHVFSDDVRTRIVKATHGDASGVRGAAWLWQENLWRAA